MCCTPVGKGLVGYKLNAGRWKNSARVIVRKIRLPDIEQHYGIELLERIKRNFALGMPYHAVI